jgi:drug/metabolite transporter (DMT)-like permease
MTSFLSNQSLTGPALIGLAAFFWATDALVRFPATQIADPTLIVFAEHLLGVLALLPWIYSKHRRQLFSLSPKEWLAAAFCGIGGSALGTLFFTASFLYINPSLSVLLQKLQPVMVVCIAFLILGERPAKKFYFWGAIALLAGIVLSFPSLDFKFISQGMDLHSKGIQYAFAASSIWAASTVGGKILVRKTAPALATFWRFAFGLATLGILMILSKDTIPLHTFMSVPSLISILYISLIPGLAAMLAYYSGLNRTSASVTAFLELLYPIGAVVLNTIFLHTPLEPVQIIAGTLLLASVTAISF